VKSLHKITHSKRYLLRKQIKTDWITNKFWISRLLGLLIQKGKKHFILTSYYKTLFLLKFDQEDNSNFLLTPLYDSLEISVPLIGFTRVRGKRRRRVLNPQWRPRIERPLRCYNLAFRWVRSLLKTITTKYLYERFILITEALLSSQFNSVLIQKFKHYETAIRFMNYLRVRRLKQHKKQNRLKRSINFFSVKV
jgi:hypothetical protein